MSVGGLILFVAFLVAVIAIVVAPLLRATPAKVKAKAIDLSSPLIDLEAQHQATVASLRDLDFDYQTGKLSDTDYHAQRELLMQRGAEILRQIDALAATAIAAPLSTPLASSASSSRKRKA